MSQSYENQGMLTSQFNNALQSIFSQHGPNCFCQFCATRLPTPPAPMKMSREDLGIVDQLLDDKVGMDG